MSGDRVTAAGRTSLTAVDFLLDDNVDEADGLPASIPFGPHAALVNPDYMRLRFYNHEVTSIGLDHGIHPQTRSCLRQFTLLDDGLPSPNRFVLLADSSNECRRAERSREGELLFADDVPEALRQAVRPSSARRCRQPSPPNRSTVGSGMPTGQACSLNPRPVIL